MLQLYDLFVVRYRWTFVVVFVTALAAAAAITLTLPEKYRADATLIVGENRPLSTGTASVQLDEVLTRTYSALLETSAVEREVLRRVPFQMDRAALADNVTFEVNAGTRLIMIRVLDADPRRAQQLADAYALTFVAQQKRSAVEASRAQLDELSAQIGRLSYERRTLEGATTREGIERLARVEAELEAARDAYASTRRNSALQGTNVSLASRATLPTTPAEPRTKLLLALGVLFAFVLAALAVLLRNLFDDRVRSEDEVSTLLGAPVLARVPAVRHAARTDRSARQSLDVLRTVLQQRERTEGIRVIAITGADKGDGKTEVVTLLTAAYAGVGASALAVDADLHRADLARRFGMRDPGRGLTTALVERSMNPSDVTVASDLPGITVLPSGPLPPNPSVLLGLPRLREILDQLRTTFDVVLVDTPPSSVGADLMAVAAAVDGVIVVIDVKTLRRRRLVRLREELSRTSTPILGIVVNRVTGDRAHYGDPYGADAPASDPARIRSGSPA